MDLHFKKAKACHVKCDACPACPVRKNDCIRVKFEVRKYFTREGAYFTVDKSKKIKGKSEEKIVWLCDWETIRKSMR